VQLFAYKGHQPKILNVSSQPIDQLILIELAGRTCYKSDKNITPNSAKKFVTSLIKSGHEAMIEFSWLTFKLPKDKFKNINPWLIDLLKNEIPIKITETDNYFLVSGNFRSFRNMLKQLGITNNDQSILISIYLLKNYPKIIDGCLNEWEINKLKTLGINPSKSGVKFWYDKFQTDGFYELPEQMSDKEKLRHYWIAARFIGSRAFTHQLVRHRLSSFAQESQRYCDESDFFDNEYFILPPSFGDAGVDKLFLGQLNMINLMHQQLLFLLTNSGLHGKKLKEDARFILPNAIDSEICIASNLEQWFRIFDLRLDSHAQWEIRRVIEEFQRQLYETIPETEKLYLDWQNQNIKF